MKKYSLEEIKEAHNVVNSTILKCEKIQPKFKEGTSQHSLLKNRIKALKISKSLLSQDEYVNSYTLEELRLALPPIVSIISKCRKAQEKHEHVSKPYLKFQAIIDPMDVCKDYLEEAIHQQSLLNK